MSETMAPVAGVTAYLTVADGAAALAFYGQAYGAEVLARFVADDGKRLIHARLSINGGVLMLSDDFPEMNGGKPRTPQPGAAHGVVLAMEVDDCDTWFARAIAAGATAKMQPADMFWGDRYAQVVDPFGHEWHLSSKLGR